MAKRVNKQEAEKIIDTFKPIGIFYMYDNEANVYVGIDNSSGECWVEEFYSLEDCLEWLGVSGHQELLKEMSQLNLTKLFEVQKPLRSRIIEKHNLQGENLMENFVLAFQVELAELANEWRGFKHWSTDRAMRKEKALEEFADCTAFLLELGLELNIPDEWDTSDIDLICESTVQRQFISFNECLKAEMDAHDWHEVASRLIGLGKMLGFTKKEMVEAYMKKTEINHIRQSNGY